MSTRGMIGIRNNQILVEGYYNHFDSYYDNLGEKVVECYFNGEEITSLVDFDNEERDSRDFLQDGLFCEFAYIYNQDNDTLEIYRGFFKTKQTFDKREGIINSLNKKDKEYYCHLIIIVDRKKHIKEQVLKAFKRYNKWADTHESDKDEYPEREIIKLEIPNNYKLIV